MPPPPRLRRSLLAVLVALIVVGPAHAIDDNLTRGATNNHIFESGIWGEYIDILNGGLNLTIPIGPEYKVSPELAYQMKLTYSSKIWQMNSSNINSHSRSRLQGRGAAGLGFNLHMGRMYMHAASSDCRNYEWLYEDPTGATHLRNGDVAQDGSYIRFGGGDTNPTAQMPSGTKMIFGHHVPDRIPVTPVCQPNYSASNDPVTMAPFDVDTNDYRGDYVSRIEGKDRDPKSQAYNWVNVTYDDPNIPALRNLIKTITDSHGRTITFHNEQTAPDPNGMTQGFISSIDVPAFDGQVATYSFEYQTADVTDLFVQENHETDPGWSVNDPGNPQWVFENVRQLTAVVFPNGYRMEFGYLDDLHLNALGQPINSGLLQWRKLPTGGLIEYDYEGYPFQHKICGKLSTGICAPQFHLGSVTSVGITSYTSYCSGSSFPSNPTCITVDQTGTYGVEVKRLIPDPMNQPQGVATWIYRREDFADVLIGTTLHALSNPYKVIVTDPVGNDTVTWFHAEIGGRDPNNPAHNDNEPWWRNGLVRGTVYFEGSSDLSSNRIRTDWQNWEDTPESGVPSNLGKYKRVTESGTTYHQDNRRTRKDFDEFDGYGNFRVIREYDEGDLLYRLTRQDYHDVTGASPACPGLSPAQCAAWVLGTYTHHQVEDPDGRVLERSEYSFDGLGYLRARRDLVNLPAASAPVQSFDPAAGFAGDVLTAYCYEGEIGCAGDPGGVRTGNLRHEKVTGYVFDPDTTTTTGSTAREQVFTYEHGPYLKTRQIVGMPWLSENRVIDATTGLTRESIDPSEVTTTFDYDELGRLTAVTPGSVNGTEQPATIDYPDINTTLLQQSEGPDNFISSQFQFDGLGRLRRVDKRQPDGTIAKQETALDPQGRKLFESEWVDAGTQVIDPNTGLGITGMGTTVDYTDTFTDPTNPRQDPFNRVRKLTTADGKVAWTDYLGLSSSVTVEGIQSTLTGGLTNATTFYRRDVFDRLVEVLSPRAAIGLGQQRIGADASYAYDPLDRLVRVRLEGNLPPGVTSQFRSFTYDGLGRQVTATHPESGASANTLFDALGNVLERTDAAENRFQYKYDVASRLTQVNVIKGGTGGAKLQLKNEYDKTGAAFSHTAGKLSIITAYNDDGSPIQKEERTYGGLNGRLSERRVKMTGWNPALTTLASQPALTMTYAYDALGLLASLTYPETIGAPRPPAQAMFSYSNGMLTGVTEPTRGSLVELLTYNAAGGVETVRTRGGVESLIVPDVRNRPGSITITGPASGGGSATLLATGPYAYDGAGNIASIGDGVVAPRDRFAYDSLNRLVTATVTHNTNVETLSWTYDPFGNMLAQNRTTDRPLGGHTFAKRCFAVETARNQLTDLNLRTDGSECQEADHFPPPGAAATHLFDANGNIRSDPGHEYQFDFRNRLGEVRAADGALTARYDYDGDGYRFRKYDAGTGMTTYYLRDLNGQTLSEFRRPARATGTPAWGKDYVYAAGRHVAMIENGVPLPPGGVVVSPQPVTTCQVTGPNAATTPPGESPPVELNWRVNPESDLLGYRIHRSTASEALVFDSEGQEPNWFDTATLEGETYTYRITAVDQSGLESAFSEPVTITIRDTTPPPAPALTSVSAGDRRAYLTWTPPAGVADLWGTIVWMRRNPPDPNSVWQQVGGAVRDTKYTVVGLDNNIPHTFKVSSVDTAGLCSSPSTLVIQVTPVDQTAPDKPQSLHAFSGTTWVELGWLPNREDDLAGYRLYRTSLPVDPNNPQPPLLAGQPSATTYQDQAGVISATSYLYQVSAVDDDGNESLLSDAITVLAKDASIVPLTPGSVTTRWGYCGDFFIFNEQDYCSLPHNLRWGCDLCDQPDCDLDFVQCAQFRAGATDENKRTFRFFWPGVASTISGFRVYDRRSPFEPYALNKELPVAPSVHYPLKYQANLQLGRFTYFDYAPNTADACSNLTYRFTTVGATGLESAPTDPVTLDSVLLAPENLMVLAEPFDTVPGSCAPLVDHAAFQGMTLNWTSVNTPCDASPIRFHVYRSRNGGGPAIRLTREPQVASSFRVDYPLLRRIPGPGSYVFSGPKGHGCNGGLGDFWVKVYAVSNVNGSGDESALSASVWAHTNTEVATRQEALHDTTFAPKNYEDDDSTDGLEHPAPEEITAPGPVGSPTWEWFYGDHMTFTFCPTPASCYQTPATVGPPAGNWARVRWDLPTGTPNEFRLLRKAAGETDFSEMTLDFIPGDDGGVREFLWEVPRILACQDAEYAVKAIDLLGRESIASFAQPVLRHPLRPENPVGVANGASVTVSWDALPECPAGPNSQTLNSFTFWRTTNAVASCTGSMPAQSAFEQVGLNISPYDTIASHAPPTANQAYWYALKANWSTGTSGLSAGVCLSANGTIAPVVRGPVAQISVHDTWRLAEAGELGYRDDSLVPDAEVPDDAGERDFSMSPHRTIGQVHITTGLYFYHLDHLGTPRVITDVNGSLVSKHKYLPFGEELSPPQSTNTHEFTGHERDAETGLDYMLARYYGSSFGRLLSPDSGSDAYLEEPQSLNRYSYVRNNPIKYVDPDGEKAFVPGNTKKERKENFKKVKEHLKQNGASRQERRSLKLNKQTGEITIKSGKPIQNQSLAFGSFANVAGDDNKATFHVVPKGGKETANDGTVLTYGQVAAKHGGFTTIDLTGDMTPQGGVDVELWVAEGGSPIGLPPEMGAGPNVSSPEHLIAAHETREAFELMRGPAYQALAHTVATDFENILRSQQGLPRRAP